MDRTMKHALLLITALIFLCSAPVPAAAGNKSLLLGVFPYLSANQMMEQLSPLAKRIEQTLGRKVSLVSAPDFASYVERTAKGEYDLVLTAPHMGRLAEKRDGWQRVVQSGQQITAVVVTRKESNLHRLDDLRGKKMAVGARLSMTRLLIEEALARKGLALGKDVEVLETATFSNVVQTVFLREAEAGGTAALLWDEWEHVSKEQHDQLREIFRSEPAAPAFLVMARPGTDQAAIKQLQDSLLSFKDTPEGKTYFQKTQQLSFLPLDDATMERIDPYVYVLTQPK